MPEIVTKAAVVTQGAVTGTIDKLFGPNRLSYRSMLVMAIATYELHVEKLSEELWGAVAISFVLGEAGWKFAEKLRGSGNQG